MKQLQHEINVQQKAFPAANCAREVLDVIPLIMRAIRSEMRRRRTRHMSVPQFRTLAFLSLCPHSSLSPLAEHLGLARPSASKLVDGLVDDDLVTRETSPADRRQIRLCLTPRGKAFFAKVRVAAQEQLASHLTGLSMSQRRQIVESMKLLRQVFADQDLRSKQVSNCAE
jgi:DNA-binding MarR family transcriptional regulator